MPCPHAGASAAASTNPTAKHDKCHKMWFLQTRVIGLSQSRLIREKLVYRKWEKFTI